MAKSEGFADLKDTLCMNQGAPKIKKTYRSRLMHSSRNLKFILFLNSGSRKANGSLTWKQTRLNSCD